MGRPRALVLVRLSWVLRGGSDNVDAAADADATFLGPAGPVWGPKSVRWGSGWGCPGSWAGGEFEIGRGWLLVRADPHRAVTGAIPKERPRPPWGWSGGCVSCVGSRESPSGTRGGRDPK